MQDSEIKALIKLLDDTDQEVYRHIEEKLLHLGKQVIPVLEDAWSSSFDGLLQQRIEHIIHKIQFDSLIEEIRIWAQGDKQDLMEFVLNVARYSYPDLEKDDILQQLSKIKREIWIELNDHLTSYEKIRIINRVLFSVYGFRGNTANYHAPQNSFINTVLESKKGSPLMLSIIYSHIAQQLELPIYGVNLPEHFVLAYVDKMDLIPGAGENHPQLSTVLFYINPFSKGTIFRRHDIDLFLSKLKISPNRQFYEPCSNLEIAQRLVRNLTYSYEKLGYQEKVLELSRIMEALSGS